MIYVLTQMKNNSIVSLLLEVIALSLIVFIPSASAYINYYISERTLSPICEVSTRYHIPKKLTQLPFDTALLVNSAILKFG